MLGNWIEDPYNSLKSFNDGTLFLLKTKLGNIHLCTLSGNMESDISLKAYCHSRCKYIRIENQKKAKALVLLSPTPTHEEGSK